MGGLENIINLRGLMLALPAVALVLLCGYVMAKNKRSRKKLPGQYLAYEVPNRTSAECTGLLSQNPEADTFAYTLETAPSGGWYIHFTRHNTTEQPLDTLFLLQFIGDAPARFSLSFVREAFGEREPVIPESLLDAFFAEKLGAVRLVVPTPDS